MATKIADAFVRLYADDRDLNKGLDGARQKTQAFASVTQGFLQGVGQAFTNVLGRGIRAAVDEIGKAVQASSNLSETVNKVGVLFGQNAKEVLDFAETADTALGQSKQSALDAAATFATFGRAAGLSGEALVKFSTDFVGLASDLASFNNTSPEEAITAIGAALRGESEPLRRYGVLLDEATLRQKALQLGIVSTTDQALTPQQRVLAAQVAIYEQTAAAQGDFARTSQGLANAQRILAAEFENGSAKLGDAFRPAVETITNLLVGLAPQMFSYAQNITDQFANGLAAGIRAIIPVITTIRQLFTYWFAPGSPPRVLPDIDKWGAAAMGQFLKGFTAVDVKDAFAGIGSAIEQILRSDVSAGKADENGLVGRVLGSQNAIKAAVAEFGRAGQISETTLQRIVRSSGSAGGSIAALVKAYFDVQKASDTATRAQEQLNRVTEKYDAILDPLRGQLDSVRAEQQRLADQQRLIAAQNTLNNFESTAAEKRAAQLEIQQISLEQQISTVEDQKKAETDKAQAVVDGAKKEQDAAQKKLDIAQATIDQQVQINNLLGEQRQLEERLAQQREADAKRAQAEAEQAANKAKQEAEQAQRLADQLHDAQLRYNLELADTPGKIKLMEAELANTTVGSVEYFNILTQIHQLQEQYNHELEQAAKKAGALGGSEAIGGLDTLAQKLQEDTEGGKSLKAALDEAFGPIPKASKSVTDLADKISALVEKIGLLFGVDFSTWGQSNEDAATKAGTAWDHYGELTASANAKTQNSLDETVAKINTFVDVIADIVNGRWAALWERYKAYAIEAYGATDTETETKLKRWEYLFGLFEYTTNLSWSQYWADWSLIISTGLGKATTTIGGWLTSIETKITGFGSTLYKAGQSLLGGFWDGLKDKWGELSSWFTSSLQSLKNQLPFSEPKDPTSPLRGLKESGAAMVDMIQSGINAASLNVNPLANSLLPAGATTNNNSTANNMVFNITVSGGGDPQAIAGATKTGILDALRASGVR